MYTTQTYSNNNELWLWQQRCAGSLIWPSRMLNSFNIKYAIKFIALISFDMHRVYFHFWLWFMNLVWIFDLHRHPHHVFIFSHKLFQLYFQFASFFLKHNVLSVVYRNGHELIKMQLIIFEVITLNDSGLSACSTCRKISSIALTIRPPSVDCVWIDSAVFGGNSLDDDDDVVGVPATFRGFGPSIVCVFPFKLFTLLVHSNQSNDHRTFI